MLTTNVWRFLGLAFGLSWLIGFGYFGLGGEITSPWYALVAVVYMAMPAVAAVIVQKVWAKRPLSDIGLTLTFNRWLIFAGLLVTIPVLLTIGTNLLMPETKFDTGIGFIREQLAAANLPEEIIAEAEADLPVDNALLPVILIGATLAAGLIAGFTINGFVALGEELGWRGFMHSALVEQGFWRASTIIGFFWGLWHLPLIINGHNYPTHPYLGVLMMIGFCMLLSPLHSFVREKANTVLAPAIMHGVINATAALPLFFVSGGHPLAKGFTGGAGLLALLIVNVGLWLYLRNNDHTVSISEAAAEIS